MSLERHVGMMTCKQKLATELTHLQKENEDALLAAAHQEQEEEDKKQNKAKYLPIPNHPIPSAQPVIVSAAVDAKLYKGGWVALWHFTNTGIKHAINFSLESNKLDIVKDSNSGMSLIPAD